MTHHTVDSVNWLLIKTSLRVTRYSTGKTTYAFKLAGDMGTLANAKKLRDIVDRLDYYIDYAKTFEAANVVNVPNVGTGSSLSCDVLDGWVGVTSDAGDRLACGVRVSSSYNPWSRLLTCHKRPEGVLEYPIWLDQPYDGSPSCWISDRHSQLTCSVDPVIYTEDHRALRGQNCDLTCEVPDETEDDTYPEQTVFGSYVRGDREQYGVYVNSYCILSCDVLPEPTYNCTPSHVTPHWESYLHTRLADNYYSDRFRLNLACDFAWLADSQWCDTHYIFIDLKDNPLEYPLTDAEISSKIENLSLQGCKIVPLWSVLKGQTCDLPTSVNDISCVGGVCPVTYFPEDEELCDTGVSKIDVDESLCTYRGYDMISDGETEGAEDTESCDHLTNLIQLSQCLGMYDKPGEVISDEIKASRQEYIANYEGEPIINSL